MPLLHYLTTNLYYYPFCQYNYSKNACEIDKYAIKVTQDNYPNIIQRGSVTDLRKLTMFMIKFKKVSMAVKMSITVWEKLAKGLNIFN